MIIHEAGVECPEEGWSFNWVHAECVNYYEKDRVMDMFAPYDPITKTGSVVYLSRHWFTSENKYVRATDEEIRVVHERVERGVRAMGENWLVESPNKEDEKIVWTQEYLAEVFLGKKPSGK